MNMRSSSSPFLPEFLFDFAFYMGIYQYRKRNRTETLEGKGTRMNAYSLPPDTDTLLCIAESVAAVLEERHEELGVAADAEAQLRASIAAANFRISQYLTLAAARDKSLVALSLITEAKTRCHRSVEQLRRRITRSIAHLCRIMDAADLISVSEHVIAGST